MAASEMKPSDKLSGDDLNVQYHELISEYERTSDVQKLFDSLEYIQAAVKVATDSNDQHDRAAFLNNLGRCRRLLFKATGDRTHIEAAVKASRESLIAAKNEASLLPLCGANLSEALAESYFTGNSANLSFLKEALLVARDAVAACRQGDQYRGSALSTLASRLGQYYEYVENDDAILGEAIEIGRELLGIDDDLKGVYALNLAVDLRNRYSRYGRVDDLLEAKELLTEATTLFPAGHINRLAAARQLSDCVIDLCGRRSQPAMISEALTAMSNIQLDKASDLDMAKYYHSLSRLHHARYEQNSDIAELEHALDSVRKALALSTASNALRGIVLEKLGTVLAQYAEYHMSARDMDESIQYAKEAADLAADLPARQAAAHNGLANRLDNKYALFGDIDNLHASLKARRKALALLPEGHNDQATRMHNLAIALRRFYEQLGSIADLDESIELERSAFALLDANDDPDKAMAMDGLSHSLSMRANLNGDSHDVDEAVNASKAAVAASIPGSTFRPAYLNSLANRLTTRYHQYRHSADLDQAIEAVCEAITASAGDTSSEIIFLVTLSNCLATRYDLNRREKDLDDSLEAIRSALELCSETNPSKLGYKHNLGMRLEKKYELATDRNEKIKILQKAHDIEAEVIESLPENHPDLPDYLPVLARRQLYLATFTDETDEPALFAQLRVAGETFFKAYLLTYATPLQKIESGDLASVCLLPLDEWQKTATMLADCVGMFRLVSPPSLDEQDRQRQLRGLSGLSTRAASCYISLGDLEAALEVLEAGRGIMANIAMGFHADLTPIKEANPEVHDEYVRLRGAISQPLQASTSHGADAVGMRNMQMARMEELEKKIRELPGLADFNKTLTAKQMQALASHGPLVCFCTSEGPKKCHALIVTTESITALLLPDLIRSDIMKRLGMVVGASRLSNAKPASNPNKKMKALLAWLWDKAVKPVMEHLKLMDKSANDGGRLWWVSSGPLGLLPLHAAGKGHKYPAENVYAHVISSYTPSFSAVAFARQCQSRVSTSLPKAALITMPQTPGGLGNLSTEAESQAIRDAFSTLATGEDHLAELCQPTATQVLERVRSSGIDIFHFACHAEPDLNDPSNTALLFGHDPSASEPDPLPVKELRRYDNATDSDQRAFRLAYLSACCTAQQYDLRLIDENIHLAAAFQLSGFPSVIGTLWEADDTAAVVIARAFYEELFRLDWVGEREGEKKVPSGANVARAWHAATEACRQRKVERGNAADDVLGWGSFVHIGV